MRKLESSYKDFPIQMMMCHFYGLKPVTYNATFDSLVEKQYVSSSFHLKTLLESFFVILSSLLKILIASHENEMMVDMNQPACFSHSSTCHGCVVSFIFSFCHVPQLSYGFTLGYRNFKE